MAEQALMLRFIRSDAYLERAKGNVPSECIVGPYAHVQLTYNMLRSTDDEFIAHYDPTLDLWVQDTPEPEDRGGWTDIVIYADGLPDDAPS